MAKDDSTDPATEIKDIISTGRKRSLNFALMKSKEGVVLKAHITKASSVMVRECKAAGGLPAMKAQGILNVRGKLIELTLEDPDVSDTLAKHAKKYFVSLGIPCKIAFLLPGGGRLGDDDDGDETEDVNAVDAGDDEDTTTPEPAPADQMEEPLETMTVPDDEGSETAAIDPTDELRDILLKEFDALSPKLESAKSSDLGPMIKKIEAIQTMFQTTIEQDPKKARGVLELLAKTLEKLPASSASATAPTGGRMADLEALENSVDSLLAEFA